MKAALKIFAVLLLLINGVGAVYGGYELMVAPDGTSMKMPLDMLRHSPFHDFFIPGLLLFISNGLSSFIVLVLVFVARKYPVYIIAQGAVLTGWIAIQLLMLQSMAPLHIVFLSIGISLAVSGWVLELMDAGQRI